MARISLILVHPLPALNERPRHAQDVRSLDEKTRSECHSTLVEAYHLGPNGIQDGVEG